MFQNHLSVCAIKHFSLRFKPLSVALILFLMSSGCSSTSSSNTARTGTEQLLISTAIDEALNKIEFDSFEGQKVHVKHDFLECVDKNYVVSSVRHHVFRVGAQIVEKPEDADVVVELRSGSVGTDTNDSFIGMPEITLPGMLTLPEVRLLTKSNQVGTAKIGLIAYDPKTNQALGIGGTTFAQADRNDLFILGIGPYQNGSLKEEVAAGNKVKRVHSKDYIPKQVAFASPDDYETYDDDNSIQMTSGEKEVK